MAQLEWHTGKRDYALDKSNCAKHRKRGTLADILLLFPLGGLLFRLHFDDGSHQVIE